MSGFQTLPPWFSLGFHYSKWDHETSAKQIIRLNDEFESNGFPVDVFWMDLPYTNGNRYFTFNQDTFNSADLQEMSLAVIRSDRRLVVITDPHIKNDEWYHVR